MVQHICKKCSARIEKINDTDYQCVVCGTQHRSIEDQQGILKGFILAERQPLGLPKGSVRALVTILLGTMVLYFSALSTPPEGLLYCFLTIVFYYFGFRKKDKFITVGGTRIQAEIQEPLYLPQGSIRTVILVIGVAVFFLSGADGVSSHPSLSVFFYCFTGLLTGYWITRTLLSSISPELLVIINDIKALTVIAAAVSLGLFLFAGIQLVPIGLEYAVISFYFGSRK